MFLDILGKASSIMDENSLLHIWIVDVSRIFLGMIIQKKIACKMEEEQTQDNDVTPSYTPVSFNGSFHWRVGRTSFLVPSSCAHQTPEGFENSGTVAGQCTETERIPDAGNKPLDAKRCGTYWNSHMSVTLWIPPKIYIHLHTTYSILAVIIGYYWKYVFLSYPIRLPVLLSCSLTGLSTSESSHRYRCKQSSRDHDSVGPGRRISVGFLGGDQQIEAR